MMAMFCNRLLRILYASMPPSACSVYWLCDCMAHKICSKVVTADCHELTATCHEFNLHFDTFQHSGKIISDGCTNPIRCTELYRSDALGSDAVECLLVGCTQMDADMSGLLQRMLAKLDDTHLAACIADSTFWSYPASTRGSNR